MFGFFKKKQKSDLTEEPSPEKTDAPVSSEEEPQKGTSSVGETGTADASAAEASAAAGTAETGEAAGTAGAAGKADVAEAAGTVEVADEPEAAGIAGTTGTAETAGTAGEAAPASEAWPVIPPLNRINVNGEKPALPEDFTEEEKEKLGPCALQPEITEESLKPLTLQELLFVTTVFAMKHGGEKDPGEQVERNSRTLHNELLNRVRSAEKFYCLYEKSTGYPLLENGFVLLYLDRGHAEKGAELYRAQYRSPDIREFTDGNAFFNRLYYLGMERILVDNGFYKGILGRGEMTAPPDALLQEGQTIQAAPALCFAMIDVLQELHWPVKYEKRDEILKEKLDRVSHLAAAARFLLPVDVKAPATGENPDAETVQPLQRGMQIRAPLITVGRRVPPKEQGGEPQTITEKLIPLYTDFYEYRKNMEPKAKLRPMSVRIQQIGSFLSQASGVMINAEGEKITIRKEKIAELMTEKAQGKTPNH